MAAQLLRLHWKSARWILFPFVLATAALPILTARFIVGNAGGAGYGAAVALELSGALGNFYPVLAALTGALVAVTAWSWDHDAGHVYALSLPLSRARYAGLKFITGLALVCGPALILLLTAGATALVLESLGVLQGLRAYPLGLATHFLAASAAAYGLFFALAAGRMRTAVIVLSTAVALLIFGGPLMEFLVMAVPGLDASVSPSWFFEFLRSEWGPLGAFGSNWSFLDV